MLRAARPKAWHDGAMAAAGCAGTGQQQGRHHPGLGQLLLCANRCGVHAAAAALSQPWLADCVQGPTQPLYLGYWSDSIHGAAVLCCIALANELKEEQQQQQRPGIQLLVERRVLVDADAWLNGLFVGHLCRPSALHTHKCCFPWLLYA